MSQQTFTPGGMQVAEPPAPVLPMGEPETGGDDSRRKLMIAGAGVGVLILALAAFFLLKGGGSTDTSRTLPPLPPPTHTNAPAAQPPVVKLPKHVTTPVGRDPFKALYVAPVAATNPTGSGTSPSTSTGGTPTTTTSGGSTTPTTTTTPTYHPVWLQLKTVTATSATFDVGLSNGKTLKAVRYSGVKPLHTFRTFELLSIHSGVVTVKYGDGTPFQLDKSRNTMVVD